MNIFSYIWVLLIITKERNIQLSTNRTKHGIILLMFFVLIFCQENIPFMSIIYDKTWFHDIKYVLVYALPSIGMALHKVGRNCTELKL